MIDNIPNPLADKGVKREIEEKVNELLGKRVNLYNTGICDYIRLLVEQAAKWGMSEGFRMGWHVYETTKGGEK